MAGSKVSDYGIGDSNIQSVMLTLDKTYKGYHQVSLTNYNLTTESAIAAGSVVECNGALYKFDSEEAITGTPSDGTVYIQLVPDGDSITAAYTNTAPTWSDSKQGWYGTVGAANYRYLEYIMILESSAWLYKENLWCDVKNRHVDYIYYTANGSQSVSTLANIVFQTEKYDFSSNYNNTTGVYTAPSHGIYVMNCRLDRSGSPTNPSVQFVNYDGSIYKLFQNNDSNSSWMSCVWHSKKGDQLYVRGSTTAGSYTVSDTSFLEIKMIK